MGTDSCGGQGTSNEKFVTFYDFSRVFLETSLSFSRKLSGRNLQKKKLIFGVSEVSASKVCGGESAPLHFQKRSYAYARLFQVTVTDNLF